jgi:hypothetical protein
MLVCSIFKGLPMLLKHFGGYIADELLRSLVNIIATDSVKQHPSMCSTSRGEDKDPGAVETGRQYGINANAMSLKQQQAVEPDYVAGTKRARDNSRYGYGK